MENYLREVIEGVSRTRGTEFFNAIVLKLNIILNTDYTFIAAIDRKRYCATTIALAAKGQLIDNIEYSLTDTPCANVFNDSVCFYPEKVAGTFPQDQLLTDMKIEGYLGAPLHDSKGAVMGLIVALSEQPIANKSLALTLFQVFSGRIEAEWERIDYENKLKEMNANLESTVLRRTEKLQTTLDHLEATQNQLVEAEKMALLGKLVAGLAHEVNTPLGVAITSNSVVQNSFNELKKQLQADNLSLEHMHAFCDTLDQALPLISANLDRAGLLVESFKRTAADQHHIEREDIHLGDYYRQISHTLQPLIKNNNVRLNLDVVGDVWVNTYPGAHAQILTNLIDNSIKHGFSPALNNAPATHQDANGTCEQNRIDVKITRDDKRVTIDYHDNGKGLSAEEQKRIFEPFYTTTRAEGGTGLGMSIFYNLLVHKLQGHVTINSDNPGFHITFSIPFNISADSTI